MEKTENLGELSQEKTTYNLKTTYLTNLGGNIRIQTSKSLQVSFLQWMSEFMIQQLEKTLGKKLQQFQGENHSNQEELNLTCIWFEKNILMIPKVDWKY